MAIFLYSPAVVWFLVLSFMLSPQIAGALGPSSMTPEEYMQRRNAVLAEEASERIGGKTPLTPKEQVVDKFLRELKQKTISQARINGTIFPPARSFFQSKQEIETSPIFKMIQKMPKGCVLHTHDSSLTSLEWVVKNVTYRPNCYMCFLPDGSFKFQFFKEEHMPADCSWKTVKSLREQSGDPDGFDKMLMKNFSIIVDDPAEAYPTINDVWKKFMKYFQYIGGLFSYAPVFQDYFKQALEEFRQDNVQCLEVRALCLPTYNLDGSTNNDSWAVKVYNDIATQFMRDHPDFSAIKIIVSSRRTERPGEILGQVKQAMQWRGQYPGLVVGYDLVGQEDVGKTLLQYLPDLLYPSQQQPPFHLPYFFHAGESDWEGTSVDDNLVDAMLLNTTRLGHGYALYKHPKVLEAILERSIAVEVNPISNQVLGLLTDLRNHPATFLIANNYPVVISSDDPAVWEAAPLSHDMYMALMALSGETSGLSLVKQLVLNSFQYSAMTQSEKYAALKTWSQKWDTFINAMIRDITDPNPTVFGQ